MFFGGPAVHFLDMEAETREARMTPICGFSGAEEITILEENVTCRDCAAILGVEPADLKEANK
jgi:hypothetical protein